MQTYYKPLPAGRAWFCLSVLAFLPIQAYSQAPPVDPQLYRQEKERATAIFLDRSQSTQARLAAVPKLGYPEEKTFAALLAIGADTTENSAIRAAALKRHRFDEKYFEVVTRILEDPGDGDEDLDTMLVLDLSQRVTFRAPAAIRQRMQEVLRKLLDDKRDRVRLQAYRSLVAGHDSVAINRLSESLRTGQNVPVPLSEGINLLDQDGSINHIGVLRPYIDHTDPKVRAQAARALAVDPRTRPKIIAMVRDSSTPTEVRLKALRALSREDAGFSDYVIPLVENRREDAAVRQAAMHAFTGRMNNNKVDPKMQVRFAQAVKRIAADSGNSKSFQSAAAELHAYLVKTFPAVRQAQ